MEFEIGLQIWNQRKISSNTVCSENLNKYRLGTYTRSAPGTGVIVKNFFFNQRLKKSSKISTFHSKYGIQVSYRYLFN